METEKPFSFTTVLLDSAIYSPSVYPEVVANQWMVATGINLPKAVIDRYGIELSRRRQFQIDGVPAYKFWSREPLYVAGVGLKDLLEDAKAANVSFETLLKGSVVELAMQFKVYEAGTGNPQDPKAARIAPVAIRVNVPKLYAKLTYILEEPFN